MAALKRLLLSAAIAFSFMGCSSESRHFPSGEDRVDRLIRLCSAGISASLRAELGAIFARGGGVLSAEIQEQIRGAIFSEPSISGSDKVLIYNGYVDCIRENMDSIAVSVPANAEDIVERVLYTNNFGSASLFSSYDWIAAYDRAYKNIGDYPVECRLRIRGVLRARIGRGGIRNVGETDNHQFRLSPGQTAEVSGDVGIYGFTTATEMVSVDDRIECWIP